MAFEQPNKRRNRINGFKNGSGGKFEFKTVAVFNKCRRVYKTFAYFSKKKLSNIYKLELEYNNNHAINKDIHIILTYFIPGGKFTRFKIVYENIRMFSL